MNQITYRRQNEEIECIHYKNWTKAYPAHTHTDHLVLGYVEEEEVCLVLKGKSSVYKSGQEFSIPPDTLHELKPVNEKGYSMLVACIRFSKLSKSNDDSTYLAELKDTILEQSENIYLIEEMAKDSNISPWHMIRQFKKAYGLTPHKFQIQCKVRKAQKLLQEDKSICEVTYESGFCDQSHLDRCFQKLVGLTPTEYKNAVKE